MSFSFSQESLTAIDRAVRCYPQDRQASAVLFALNAAQRENRGWLSQDAIAAVADLLKMPVIKVWEAASFYSMFNLEPAGKHHVRICTTPPCMLCQGPELLAACEQYLGIKAGETTQDGLFTLSEAECLGACTTAPVAHVNDTYWENLTPQEIIRRLEEIRQDEVPLAETPVAAPKSFA